MVWAHPDTVQSVDVGAQMIGRLAAFMRTLRDNGFAVGLKESEDAALVMASDLATRPAILRMALKALVCARHSDWQKFDAIFDAFWRGRGARRVVLLSARITTPRAGELRRLAGADPQAGLLECRKSIAC